MEGAFQAEEEQANVSRWARAWPVQGESVCRGRTPVHTQEVSRDHDEELGVCSKNKGRPGQDFKAQVGCGSVYTFFKDVSGCSVETEPGAAGAEVGQ